MNGLLSSDLWSFRSPQRWVVFHPIFDRKVETEVRSSKGDVERVDGLVLDACNDASSLRQAEKNKRWLVTWLLAVGATKRRHSNIVTCFDFHFDYHVGEFRDG